MAQPLTAIAVFLVLLLAIPYVWPDRFSESPVPMVVILAIAAVIAAVVGHRRRARGWGTSSSA